MPLLTTHNLSVGYHSQGREHHVLSELNLQLQSGQITGLLGANGTGKSTLLRTLSARQLPLGGCVMIGDADLHHLSRKALARQISVVHTEHTSVGALTAEEVVALGRQPYTGFFGRLSHSDNEIIHQSLSAVGISSLSHRYMATLSDGEKQKVMIARALAQQTPFVLLDEPTSFLDAASRLEVMALLRDMAHRHHKAVLLSTHDTGNALSIVDNLWLIDSNGNFLTGTTSEIISTGKIEQLFTNRDIHFDHRAGDFRIGKNSK